MADSTSALLTGLRSTSSESISRLEIRLLGGFEVQRDGEPVAGFESQSSRAILAYLACHPDRSVPREVLTDLLWPEVETAAARHNLRQALYSLRGALTAAGVTDSPLVTTFRTVGLEPRAGVWIDVREYREHLSIGNLPGSPLEPHALARAVALFRGDFLAGFYVRDSPAFEEWMLTEQEHLREAGLSALRELIRHHTELGTYAMAIQYAHAFLRLDRFSEDTHRNLMRLYSLSGRRSRALAHFADVKALLAKELGVSPARETLELLRELEREPEVTTADAQEVDRAQPIVPLVGRDRELSELRRVWKGILERGTGALTLVGGEAGVGKTRLIKAFLDRETTGRLRILQGRCYRDAPVEAYQPIAEALRNAIIYESDVAERVLAAGQSNLCALASFVPALVPLLPPSIRLPASRAVSRKGLASAVGRLLELLVDRGGEGARPARSEPASTTPVVLFLEDLHHADAATFDLILALLPRLALHPIWILGTYCPERLTSGHRLGRLAEDYGGRTPIQYLAIDRLGPAAFEEISATLVGGGLGPSFARWLYERSEGLPVVAVELINWLWSQRELVPRGEGRWTLASGLDLLSTLPVLSLGQLLLERIYSLPTSVRRLLALASVIGPTFEGTLLRDAENEHDTVVSTGLQVLGEQWLAHPFPHYWADTRRDRDRAGYAAGSLAGTFEFSHDHIRSVAYELLTPARARDLHRRIAQVLEKEADGRLDELCEVLGYHYRRAEETALAAAYCESSGHKALRVEGFDLAREYFDLGLDLLDRDKTLPEGQRREARDRLNAALADLPPP